MRNLSKVFEVMTEKVRTTRDSEVLVEGCRQALGPALSAALATDGHLAVITMEPLLEQQLGEVLRTSDNGSFLALPPTRPKPDLAVAQSAQEAEARGRDARSWSAPPRCGPRCAS